MNIDEILDVLILINKMQQTKPSLTVKCSKFDELIA